MEQYQQIERSIITTYRSKIWFNFVKAVKEFHLINEGDKICVCISGGKDSMLMAKLIQEINRHGTAHFEAKFLVMNPGYSDENLKRIKENARMMNIPITIKDSDIFQVVDGINQNPCYLCARMRRGCLYKFAQEMGCTKIALGHHFDDVIETTLMGMFYAGQVQTMLPILDSNNYPGMQIIRPMYYIREHDIINWAKYNNLSFLRCACHFTERTTEIIHEDESKRKEIKKLISELHKTNPFIESNIYKSLYNVNLNMVLAYQKDGEKHSFMENLKEVKNDGDI